MTRDRRRHDAPACASPDTLGDSPMHHAPRPSRIAVLGLLLYASAAHAVFVNFESQQVHPIALSPRGATLLAVNTPDARLAVFDVDGGNPALLFEVPVGLEPVSVAFETPTRAWVCNHVSDTVSIVDLTSGNVVRTLAVGDEPTDVVFAQGKAFGCV